MSESVDIVYQEDVGRHGIAKADIAAGELIVVEVEKIEMSVPYLLSCNILYQCLSCLKL